MPELKAWYKLDNAAKIFPVTRNSHWENNFRVSITLKETIEPELLQEALAKTLPRFPNFSLTIKRGFFWYYLEHISGIPQVEPDVSNPLTRFHRLANKRFLFRVRYYECRISVELFHVLADGNSAMMFLKTLAAQYLIRKGYPISTAEGVLDVEETPSPEEMEDSYQKYASFHVNRPRGGVKAYQPDRDVILPPREFGITTGQIQLEPLLSHTKAMGVSVTEYLASILIYCYMQKQEKEKRRKKKPVKVCIPVNLRAFYPSKTFRNFILYVNPGIDPRYGEYTFEEIVHQVHHFMKLHVNEKTMNAMMSTNLGSEKNAVLRAMPLFIKNIGMRIAYQMFGETLACTTLSNIGSMRLPDEMIPFVERFDFILNWPRKNLQNVSAVGYGNKINVSFSSKTSNRDIEREFFRFLVRRGIPVRVESNR